MPSLGRTSCRSATALFAWLLVAPLARGVRDIAPSHAGESADAAISVLANGHGLLSERTADLVRRQHSGGRTSAWLRAARSRRAASLAELGAPRQVLTAVQRGRIAGAAAALSRDRLAWYQYRRGGDCDLITGTLLVLLLIVSGLLAVSVYQQRQGAGGTSGSGNSGDLSVDDVDYESWVEDAKLYCLFRWASPLECKKFKIKLAGQMLPFEDFTSAVKVSPKPTRDELQKTLAKYSVKLQGGNDHLDELCKKVSAYDTVFMTRKGGPNAESNIVFIESCVQICFTYRGRMLKEMLPGDDKGESPTLERLHGELPVTAAKRFWTQTLKMPEGIARFTDGPVEHIDANDYPGLRCVHRIFQTNIEVDAAQVKKANPQVISQIGLPKHKAFDCPDPLVPTETLHFAWVRCLSFADDSGIAPDNLFDDAGQPTILEIYLQKFDGPDLDKWTGQGGTRTVRDLAEEITRGKCVLMDNGKGGLQRVVCVMTLRLRQTGKGDDNTSRALVELGRRKDKRGEITWKPQWPGTSMKKGETVLESALRVSRNFLGLDERDVHIKDEAMWEYSEIVEPSKTFPGLEQVYRKYFVNCELADDPELAKSVGLRPSVLHSRQ